MARRAGSRGAQAMRSRSQVSPPVSRAEYVFTQLRDDILSGSLPPGTPLVQSEIAQSAGVSVTPVREALRRLESAGLVSYELHLGATVTRIGDDALEELYLLRARVEGLAARLAAARWSDDDLDKLGEIHQDMLNLKASEAAKLAVGSRLFHRAIAEIGGPAYILGQVESIWERSPVDFSRSIWNDPVLAQQEMQTHQEILDAIRRRDQETAESMMAGHIADAISIRRRLGDTASKKRSVAGG